MMEVFIGGLPQIIKGNVTASKPQTLEEIINISQRIMDQVLVEHFTPVEHNTDALESDVLDDSTCLMLFKDMRGSENLTFLTLFIGVTRINFSIESHWARGNLRFLRIAFTKLTLGELYTFVWENYTLLLGRIISFCLGELYTFALENYTLLLGRNIRFCLGELYILLGIELYMQNREHGRIILESVEHGTLDWLSIEVNGVTKFKKYAKLSVSEKLQADCDLKATNIIFQGLPIDVYALVNHHRIAKDLWEQVQLLMQALMFKQEDDPIDAINKMMSFLSTGIPNSYGAGTSGKRANYFKNKRKNFREGHMAGQCIEPKRKRDVTWFGEKVLLVEAQGNGKVLTEKELEFLADPDTYDSDCDDITTAKVALMASLSRYSSSVLTE
nr:reverse transcriptase domain-containing protein [Tanacetum cinerariifolium]